MEINSIIVGKTIKAVNHFMESGSGINKFIMLEFTDDTSIIIAHTQDESGSTPYKLDLFTKEQFEEMEGKRIDKDYVVFTLPPAPLS